MSLEGAIAAHRFGLGARPGEIDRASRDPKAWLQVPDQYAGGAAGAAGRRHVQEQRRSCRRNATSTSATGPWRQRNGTGDDPVKTFFKVKAQEFLDELAARFALGFTTDTAFCRTSGLVLEQSFHRLGTEPARDQLSPAPSSAKRSARTSPASSRTCCWPPRAIPRCCSISTMRSRSARTRSPAICRARASTKISAAS